MLLSLDTKVTTPYVIQLRLGPAAFSPDGTRIAFVSKRGADPDRHENWDIYELDIETPSNVRKLTQSTGPDGDPSWWNRPIYSPSGERLLYLDGGMPKIFGMPCKPLARSNANRGAFQTCPGSLIAIAPVRGLTPKEKRFSACWRTIGACSLPNCQSIKANQND